MELSAIWEFILHIDIYLQTLIDSLGIWSYFAMFAVLYCETAFVVTVFLPSDVVIFSACALTSANSALFFPVLIPMFFVAAYLGDTTNYHFGKLLGNRLLKKRVFFIKKDNLEKAIDFYERNSATAITISRFVPILRSLAPLIAGANGKPYRWFARRNAIGVAIWTVIYGVLGFFFGNIPFVQQNFGMIVIGVMIMALLAAIGSTVISRVLIKKKSD